MRSVLLLCVVQLYVTASDLVAQGTTDQAIRKELLQHAGILNTSGKEVLLKEAAKHQYFLLGELHGENEIPHLLSDLWPVLWRIGYRHVAAEVSPWAATHLQRSAAEDATPVPGLWTRRQTAELLRFAAPGQSVLWGCDIEEEQPDQLIKQMAELNPADAHLGGMLELISGGYSRKHAPELARLAETEHPAHDLLVGGESLWKNTLDTLHVEALRSDHQRYLASDERERVMKNLLLRHLDEEPQGKVLLRFGRNHLHRGIDARGISTLGNFVSELALAKGKSVVNIGTFAAGGEEHLAGKTFSADERQDEPTFALLATFAQTVPVLFALRDLRPILHAIPSDKLTPLQRNLTYWADSYDFLLCYPNVSPLTDLSADPH